MAFGLAHTTRIMKATGNGSQVALLPGTIGQMTNMVVALAPSRIVQFFDSVLVELGMIILAIRRSINIHTFANLICCQQLQQR